jgi:hypothetical protein
MEARTIAVRPAAGPLTLRWELLITPITIPPTIPADMTEKNGAPEASAIPRQSGRGGYKKHNILAGKSCFLEIAKEQTVHIKRFKLIRIKEDSYHLAR